MTTTTIVTTTIDPMASTSFTANRISDYDATWTQARSGNKAAITALIGEIETRRSHIHVPTGKPNNYQHWINQTNIRQSSRNYSEMITLLQQVLAERLPLSSLDKIKANRVLVEPHMESFTHWDLQMFLIGMRKGGSANKYRGLGNYLLPNYGILTPHAKGVLLTLNEDGQEKQYIMSSDTASELMGNVIKKDAEARTDIKRLKEAGSLTPEAREELSEKFCHFQRVPFTQGGVFPNNGGNAGYDGCTMILKEGTAFLTVDGQPVELMETTRISLEHWLYVVLVYTVAVPRGISSLDKFTCHQTLAEELFGENCLPCNDIEMRQLWDLSIALVKAQNDDYRWKTDKEVEAGFEPGRYLTIRHFTCPDDIRNIDTYIAGIEAFQQDQAKRAEENAAKTTQRQAEKNQTPEEDNLDDHPFGA